MSETRELTDLPVTDALPSGGEQASSLGIRGAFNAFHDQLFADRLAVSLLPKGPNVFEPIVAALEHVGETAAKGTKEFFRYTKERGQKFFDTVRRSLAENAVGSLVEIDTSDISASTLVLRPIVKKPQSAGGTYRMSRGDVSFERARPADERILDRLAESFGRRTADGEIGATEKQKEVFLRAFDDVAEREGWTAAKRQEKFTAYFSIISGRDLTMPTAEGSPKKPIPEDIFRTPAPVVEPEAVPPAAEKTETLHIADLEGADYGTVPKLAGEATLAAWASGIRGLRGDNEFAEDQSVLLDEFLEQMAKWGWNDAATNAAFDMFSDILYPGQATVVNPAADLASAMRSYEAKRIVAEQGAPGKKAPRIVPVPQLKRDDPSGTGAVVPPVAAPGGTGGDDGRARTTKNVAPNGRGRVFLAGFVAGGLAVASLFGLVKSTGESATVEPHVTPTPSVSATQTPGGEQTPGGGQTTGGEQTPGNPDDADDNNGEEIPEKPQVQSKLKGAEADKKGDFVRMTSYADRHEAREQGDDASTVWWIARRQLQAVNDGKEPTSAQIWNFTDATLKHNDLTWGRARLLPDGFKIRLLPDSAAENVINQ